MKKGLSQVEVQQQQQQQQQRLSAQHMLLVKLLEMPLAELEENTQAELDDNPALETFAADDALNDDHSATLETPDDSFDSVQEREERADALDMALENIGRDDEMPTTYTPSDSYGQADYEEMVYGDTTSFYDKINEQIGELELTPREHDIMEYLVGSLDDDGLLRKPIDDIVDELQIRYYIESSEQEVERLLLMLQTFDPAGIGARSLQECLLIQLRRREDSSVVRLTEKVIEHHFDDFTHNRWQRISQAMHLDDDDVSLIRQEVHRLNPKPGASLGETQGRSTAQITPDFIVDTSDDGTVNFSLNRGQIPELKVSPSFTEMVEAFQQNPKGMSRQEKEALLYAKEKVDKAQSYINAIRQRQHTLTVTMKAIIDWQRRFFLEGDEADLRPMKLKDIAQKTGLDISTISRVSNVKYAQTKWGTFPLRFFFTSGNTGEDGEETSVRKVKLALKDIVDSEDKRSPWNDEELVEQMKKAGLTVARRTISKYRQQMGIPVARLRKK